MRFPVSLTLAVLVGFLPVACWSKRDSMLKEIKVSSIFLAESPALTAKEKDAVARFLNRVHWEPFPTTGQSVELGFMPYDLECKGLSTDGKALTADVLLYSDFTPWVAEGIDTPEYQAMAEALKAFLKRTPLKITPDGKKIIADVTTARPN